MSIVRASFIRAHARYRRETRCQEVTEPGRPALGEIEVLRMRALQLRFEWRQPQRIMKLVSPVMSFDIGKTGVSIVNYNVPQ